MALELLQRAQNHLLFDVRQRPPGETLGDRRGVLTLQPRLDRLADQPRFVFQDHRALDNVLQFPHVAGPVVMLQQRDRFRLNVGKTRSSHACSPDG